MEKSFKVTPIIHKLVTKYLSKARPGKLRRKDKGGGKQFGSLVLAQQSHCDKNVIKNNRKDKITVIDRTIIMQPTLCFVG
jgi:hypothetical protein